MRFYFIFKKAPLRKRLICCKESDYNMATVVDFFFFTGAICVKTNSQNNGLAYPTWNAAQGKKNKEKKTAGLEGVSGTPVPSLPPSARRS